MDVVVREEEDEGGGGGGSERAREGRRRRIQSGNGGSRAATATGWGEKKRWRPRQPERSQSVCPTPAVLFSSNAAVSCLPLSVSAPTVVTSPSFVAAETDHSLTASAIDN